MNRATASFRSCERQPSPMGSSSWVFHACLYSIASTKSSFLLWWGSTVNATRKPELHNEVERFMDQKFQRTNPIMVYNIHNSTSHPRLTPTTGAYLFRIARSSGTCMMHVHGIHRFILYFFSFPAFFFLLLFVSFSSIMYVVSPSASSGPHKIPHGFKNARIGLRFSCNGIWRYRFFFSRHFHLHMFN